MQMVYCVAKDDANDLKKWHLRESSPGVGWVMVRSEKLSPNAFADAMSNGNFYASSGVIISKVNANWKSYEVEDDATTTYRASKSPYIIGYKSEDRKNSLRTDFIADGSELIKREEGVSVYLGLPVDLKYLRAKITYSGIRGHSSEQFFNWIQPVDVAKDKTELKNEKAVS